MNPSIIWKPLLHFFAYIKTYFILFNLFVIDVLYANPGSCLLQRLFSLHLWENVIVSISPIYFPVVSNSALYCVVKIYIAPSKALVQEKLRHWTQKLGTLGINCLELTGDNEYYSVKSMQDADIILTTPEVVSWGICSIFGLPHAGLNLTFLPTEIWCCDSLSHKRWGLELFQWHITCADWWSSSAKWSSRSSSRSNSQQNQNARLQPWNEIKSFIPCSFPSCFCYNTKYQWLG